ncbi:TniB family NTP-binding protein [Nonomuraea sp. K274]|uniref:TniB family NTP-binding protein n=1 Tax=Nonomuraea cypriaca TaxID=1187855 RepID=A0A931ACY4_9ACTN|nr:TniB family NTP-binding protein [Nonomuraea cypriaca]MBF8188784.1 TniB family NTP-binding protein [Nonomuraea cypriaca]
MSKRVAQPRTKEQWRELCARQAPPRPELVSRSEYGNWPDERRGPFDEQRRRCNANPPFLKHPQILQVLAVLKPKLTQGQYSEDGTYHSAIINGPGHCGKTSLLKMIGKEYELAWRERHPGWAPPPGISASEFRGDFFGDRVPVIYVSVSTGATAGMLSQAVGKFLHVPNPGRAANKWTLTDPVLDAMEACGAELLLLDDLHMLDKFRDEGQEMNDHIKNLANHAAVTIVGAGILLEQGNLFSDGAPPRTRPGKAGTAPGARERGRAGQFGSRFADLQHLAPFPIATAAQQRTWMSLVRHFESNLILLDHPQGSLTLKHWRYLHERTSGYIGGLTMLFKDAAHLAMDSGVEALTLDVMNRVVLGHDDEVDYAKTKARRQTAAKRRAKSAPPPPSQETGTG